MANDNKDDSFRIQPSVNMERVIKIALGEQTSTTAEIIVALGKEIEVLAGAFDIVNAVVPTEFAAARERSAQLSRDLR